MSILHPYQEQGAYSVADRERADLWERICLALAAGVMVDTRRGRATAESIEEQAAEVLAAIEAGPPERSTP